MLREKKIDYYNSFSFTNYLSICIIQSQTHQLSALRLPFSADQGNIQVIKCACIQHASCGHFQSVLCHNAWLATTTETQWITHNNDYMQYSFSPLQNIQI